MMDGSPGLVRLLLGAVGIAILVMWWSDTTSASLHGPGAAVTGVGNVLGLLGAYLALVQLLLLARIPWFLRSVGMDRLTAWHRALGTNVVLLLVGHAVLTTWGLAQTGSASWLSGIWNVLSTYPYMIEAVVALTGFVAVAVTSAYAAKRRMSYEAWYAVHLSVYVAIALAMLHQLAGGQDFVGHPANRALWILLYAVVAVVILVSRVGRVARAYQRHGLRVESVVQESPQVVSVWMAGHHLDELRLRAGQYLSFRFLSKGHLLTAHPYSISAFRDGCRIRITVKAVGDHSRALTRLRPRTRVWAEGPYGSFTAERRTLPRSLLIAGGSGIAPIRALAESLGRKTAGRPDRVVVLYRASTKDDLALRHELDALAAAGMCTVRYLVGSRRHLRRDPLSAAGLRDLVPDIAARETWVCGPQGMVTTVRRSLRFLGIPSSQVHSEEFSPW